MRNLKEISLNDLGSIPRLHLGVVAIEKGAFGLPSTKVANLYIYISNPTVD